jgi:hypothetical protein
VRGSDELRRRTAHSGELHGLRRRAANSGDERQHTSDERGVLEGEANSSRQEWGGSAVPFIESRGEEERVTGSLQGCYRFLLVMGGGMGEGNGRIKTPLTRFETVAR